MEICSFHFIPHRVIIELIGRGPVGVSLHRGQRALACIEGRQRGIGPDRRFDRHLAAGNGHSAGLPPGATERARSESELLRLRVNSLTEQEGQPDAMTRERETETV